MRSETCRGEGILRDFNVFFNKYVHELVNIGIMARALFHFVLFNGV